MMKRASVLNVHRGQLSFGLHFLKMMDKNLTYHCYRTMREYNKILEEEDSLHSPTDEFRM